MLNKFFLEKESSLLLIVDMQEKLAAVMEEKEKVMANTLHLIEGAKLMGIPVLVTEQYPKGLGPTLPQIREALPLYEPIEKITFDCCGEPSFMNRAALGEKKKIILCGMETHICVLQTCLGLLRSGFTVHSVSDAMCSRARRNHRTGIQFMRDAGAVITCAETVLFQLLKRAGTQEFKAISKRIK